MHDPDTSAALKLWVILNRAQRAIGDRARRDLERQGLAPAEFAVLELLYHKGPRTPGEIGAGVLMASGSITYVVDKLQERGMVARRPCTEDRRAVYVELTPEARARMDEVFPRHAAAVREAMAGLTSEEKGIAAALLKRLGKHARDAE
jgi:MarR family 2-MHQ and catechol resistance regulon transcriptional repressor